MIRQSTLISQKGINLAQKIVLCDAISLLTGAEFLFGAEVNMKPTLSRILGATALSTLSTVAFADGLDPTVLTEGEVIGQISQLATVSGSTAAGAYSFAPEWSEELGFSATGTVGFRLQDNAALGLIVTGGERKREVLLNFGVEFDAERQMVLTAGQLQERLEFGTDANQEWVKQNEFGLAYETTNYALSVYHVDSETTDNFVGAKSTGAELSGSVDLSDALTMGFGAGYQTLDWDDGSEGVDGLTASLDLGYQANSTTRFNVFADRNMSENQFGFGGSWALGAGTLDATYTRIDGRVGAVTDDNRLAVAFTMPLGGKSNATVSRSATNSVSVGATPSSTLLADVMRRPDYLPERVIVKAADDVCANPVDVAAWVDFDVNVFGFGDTALPVGEYEVTAFNGNTSVTPAIVTIYDGYGDFGSGDDVFVDGLTYVANSISFTISGAGGCFVFSSESYSPD